MKKNDMSTRLDADAQRMDWLERNLMKISHGRATCSVDMGGKNVHGQLVNEARGANGGPSHFTVNHRSIREAIDDAMRWPNGPSSPNAKLTPSSGEKDALEVIRAEAWRALVIDRTIDGDVEETHPPGWMPPQKRREIILILKRILIEAGGAEQSLGSGNPAMVNHGDVSRAKLEERMRESAEGTIWIEITHPFTTEEIPALVEYLKTLADTKTNDSNAEGQTL